MNKSVPTLLGILIILMVVVLVVLVINYRITKGLGEGQRVVGTAGGELLTGEEAPEEFIDETSALGGRAAEPEPQLSPALRPESRAAEQRQGRQQRRGADAPGPGEEGGAPGSP